MLYRGLFLIIIINAFFLTTSDHANNLGVLHVKAEIGEFSDLFEKRRERYGMDWPGKKDCMKLIQQPSVATLKPCREESVNFDDTENLFIEVDNLEVLRLLQKSYYGRVKMIYIDPPYNTGKEFIYPDNFSESLDTYLPTPVSRMMRGKNSPPTLRWLSNGRIAGLPV